VGEKVAAGAKSMKDRAAAAIKPDAPASGAGTSAASSANGPATQGGADATPADTQQPAWAKRLHRRQQISHAVSTVAHTLRGGDGGGSGSSPSLRDPSDT
jgi:type IV secretion system protein TrbL